MRRGSLPAAIRDDDPVIVLEHKYLYRRIRDEVPEGEHLVPIGKAAVRREGRDVTIDHVRRDGPHRARSRGRAGRIGVEVEVLDLRTLAPLDRDAILASVARTSRALVLYEATRTGGIGGEIAAILAEEAFEYLDAPIVRLASLDTPVPYSPPLEQHSCRPGTRWSRRSKRLVRY